MLDAATLVRSLDNLQAAVLARAAIERDHHARHVREYTAIVIPIAVILMPLPCPAFERFLGRQLGVVVIHLAAKQILHGVNHAMRTRCKAIDAVARMIPSRHSGRFAR